MVDVDGLPTLEELKPVEVELKFELKDTVEFITGYGVHMARAKIEGKVVEIVPAGQLPLWLDICRKYDTKYVDGDLPSRDYESYLILAKHDKLFWPEISKLRITKKYSNIKGKQILES